MLLTDYFENWVATYKVDAVRDVTLDKYKNTLQQLREIAPKLKIEKLTKIEYQRIINKYAETHEKTTVKDFNTHLRACILDAYDEKLLDRDPTRKVIIKGKKPREKKQKFLSIHELEKLLAKLDLQNGISNDHIIYLAAVTGLRFAEIIGLTPNDFDYDNLQISVNKTLDYKSGNVDEFAETKNLSSVRKVSIDIETYYMFRKLFDGLESDKPFLTKGKRIFNSTINARLRILCEEANIPVITLHSLRHTHGSVLLHNGVSIASISKRLGHADMTTTQSVYLHIVKELEEKDKGKVIDSIRGLQREANIRC